MSGAGARSARGGCAARTGQLLRLQGVSTKPPAISAGVALGRTRRGHSNLGVVLAAQGRGPKPRSTISARSRSSRSWSTSTAISAACAAGGGRADEALARVMRGLAVGRPTRQGASSCNARRSVATLRRRRVPRPDRARADRRLGPLRASSRRWRRPCSQPAQPSGGAATGRDRPTELGAGRPSAAGAAGVRAGARRRARALPDGVRAGSCCSWRRDARRAPVDEHARSTSAARWRGQCFINEYVFAETEAEDRAGAQHCATGSTAALAAGAPFAALARAVAAATRRCIRWRSADALLQRPWPDAARARLIVQQVQEPAASATSAHRSRRSPDRGRGLDQGPRPIRRNALPALGQDGVARPADRRSTGTCAASSRQRRSAPCQHGASLDVLVAGCGTGQHAIETAQRFAGARVLAIDLSRTSLGYAIRKTREARLAQCRICAGRHPQSRLARRDAST